MSKPAWNQGSYTHGPQPSIIITTAHLAQKPLSFFVTANGSESNAWNRTIQGVKDSLGFRLGNGVVRIGYYYLQDHLSFPIQVWPLQDEYEVVIYSMSGEGRIFSKVYRKTKWQYLCADELTEIRGILRAESDRISAILREASK